MPAAAAGAAGARARVREDILRASDTLDRGHGGGGGGGGGGCSWGARMPWLPIRQDTRLAEHLRSGVVGTDDDDRSAQCRYASLSTLASTNSSLRELVLAAPSPVPAGAARAPLRPAYSLLDISTRAIRRELVRRAFEAWVRGVAQQAVAPRYFRSGAGRRYGVVSELSRGAYGAGAADTRIEAAIDLCSSGACTASGPTIVVLKVYKPPPPPAAAPHSAAHGGYHCGGGCGSHSVEQAAQREREALRRCAHPHVLRILDHFVEAGSASVAAPQSVAATPTMYEELTGESSDSDEYGDDAIDDHEEGSDEDEGENGVVFTDTPTSSRVTTSTP